MEILKRLALEEEWEKYFSYKINQGAISKKDAEELKNFIKNKEYSELVFQIQNGGTFAPPKKSLISKSAVGRKRVVYTFSREENYILKLMAFMLRDYDYLFSPNLYSFRKEKGVKSATNDILRIKNLNNRYIYKADIHDYFNSIDTALLLPKLKIALKDDINLYYFIESLLTNPYSEFSGELIKENKGIMAGVPISGFLANLYLSELDFLFYEKNIPYVRYSDDIIVFAESESQLGECVRHIKECLSGLKLHINSEKESVANPNEEWTFLGFSYNRGVVDICSVSFQKLKAKMKRKTNALKRWSKRKNASGERAAKAFIYHFNKKLFDNPIYSELTWTRWFFPVINTDNTLKKIDAYMQECIRFLATNKRTKAKYNLKYSDIKNLGYKNLVNEYYKQKDIENQNSQ